MATTVISEVSPLLPDRNPGFNGVQRQYLQGSFAGAGQRGQCQLLTEEFYTLGKLVQLGFGTSNYDGNTTLCMASAVLGNKMSFDQDGKKRVS